MYVPNGRSTALIVVLVCSLLASCVSGRVEHKMMRKDSIPVTCFEPPPDVVAKSGTANVDEAYSEIGRILKGSINISTETERIREISKSVNDYEVLDFRMCMNYANGAFTPEQYGIYVGQIRGLLQETPRFTSRQEVSPPGIKESSVSASSHEPGRQSLPGSEAARSVSSCSTSDPPISCLWK